MSAGDFKSKSCISIFIRRCSYWMCHKNWEVRYSISYWHWSIRSHWHSPISTTTPADWLTVNGGGIKNVGIATQWIISRPSALILRSLAVHECVWLATALTKDRLKSWYSHRHIRITGCASSRPVWNFICSLRSFLSRFYLLQLFLIASPVSRCTFFIRFPFDRQSSCMTNYWPLGGYKRLHLSI